MRRRVEYSRVNQQLGSAQTMALRASAQSRRTKVQWAGEEDEEERRMILHSSCGKVQIK